MESKVISLIILAALLAVAFLIGTRGRPLRFLAVAARPLQFARANWKPFSWIVLCGMLVIGFVYFFYMPPGFNVGAAQPIAFSHHLHAGTKEIACQFCHPYTARSNHPGLPPVEKCLFCHNYIIANHPEIRKEHTYFNTNTPTPWVKVFYLPEHVLFNHQRHIRKEIACESCHGQVRQMDRLKGERFKMGFCLNCHREKKVNLDCWLACHN